MIEVNLLGAITAIEVFLDQLKSGAEEQGATKWGLNGWSESLRRNFSPTSA